MITPLDILCAQYDNRAPGTTSCFPDRPQYVHRSNLPFRIESSEGMFERLVTTNGKFQLLLSCPPDLAPDCILEVFAADYPSSGLDGCWFADAAGVELAVIEDGGARFKRTALDAGITLFAENYDIGLVLDHTPSPPPEGSYR